MSWHYRIRKQYIQGEPWFDIVEFYPKVKVDEHTPHGGYWTQDGVAPGSETQEGVIEVLEMMLRDAKKYPTLLDEE